MNGNGNTGGKKMRPVPPGGNRAMRRHPPESVEGQEPEPLVFPKEFPECGVCGSTRVFCQEAMKGDLQLETLGDRVPALFSFEYVYDTPLFPMKLLAIGDVCVDCGSPRILVIEKLRGQSRLVK